MGAEFQVRRRGRTVRRNLFIEKAAGQCWAITLLFRSRLSLCYHGSDMAISAGEFSEERECAKEGNRTGDRGRLSGRTKEAFDRKRGERKETGWA